MKWKIFQINWFFSILIFQYLFAINSLWSNSVGPLSPPTFNLATGRQITASSTCGEVNGRPTREIYCTIAGASPYTPYNQYTFTIVDERRNRYREMRAEAGSFIQDGQNCDFCEANTSSAHPATNMVDGTSLWWQSPPLSRGSSYAQVNISIFLEQPFFVSYVWVQMANSPRPGTWILERSADFGFTWHPWQYFASSPAECSRLFGLASLRPIMEDDDIICTSEFSKTDPMDNGEIMINLIEGRPSKNNFGGSKKLQDFVIATNVRLRLLRPKTLQGHLMDLHGTQDQTPDVTVTRRYYYGIKEIYMVGRCICNGHSEHCEPFDPARPRLWLCKCDHNTEGESCQRCIPGFEQKRWRQSHEDDQFICEPCNCHGHSNECIYEEELDRQRKSLDINGKLEGGGHCLNCQHNTKGINCNECKKGYFRPSGKNWNETDVCQLCICDTLKHGGNCAEETGKCECLPQFTGPDCDQCAAGYFHPPECRPCECNVNGTIDKQCLPDSPNGQCPCLTNFNGRLCEKCSSGFTNISAGCLSCNCDPIGATSGECNFTTGQCQCKSSFGGLQCDRCAKGYFRNKETNDCIYCDCDPSGTEDEVCDGNNGQCLCKPGFSGRRCDQCHDQFFGYPSCRECLCHEKGSKSLECDQITGECPCFTNFTGRTCDKCSAGYYRFPDCLVCGCASAGSKGLTCDPEGQCYCRQNFQGKRCDNCLPNFFNWPVCEECNCHPAGVVPQFAGCDKVPPGELCTCRKNVQGRTCSVCKPNHWDLQPHHPEGCVNCACNMTGTLSLSNDCDQLTGQCQCKRFVDGQKCDSCQEGFYNIRADSHVGCEPCNCDVGGAIGIGCNQLTGQCRCRPRIGGLKCDRPIQDHFFPTLWHNRYEAEDGHLSDGKNVRYAIDKEQFPDFSWKGFVVFSTIQEQINLDVIIKKSAIYKLFAHYRNPTEVDVELKAKFVPLQTQTSDSEQTSKVILPPSGSQPQNSFIQLKSDQQPFVLNPGRWQLQLSAYKRLFLDYVVLVPSEYYLGSHLSEHILEICKAGQNKNCMELLYPPMPVVSTVRADTGITKFEELVPGTNKVLTILSHSPDSLLPQKVGQGALVKTEDQSKEIRVGITVPEDGIYLLIADYHSQEPNAVPVRVHVEQGQKQDEESSLIASPSIMAEGLLLVNHCPYGFFCRELMSSDGRPAMLGLHKSPPDAQIILSVQPGRQFSLGAFTLVKEEKWHGDLLKQKTHCIRKGNKCIPQQFPQPPKSIRTEAETGNNANLSISADKLPFQIAGEPAEVRLMSLDNVQSTLDIEGVVDSPGQYVFIVHYYSPDNPPVFTDVLVQNEKFADAMFHYCPSISGCRTIIVDRNTGLQQFRIEDKYLLTFYANNTFQKGPIYIDYILPVPFESFTDSVFKPSPLGLANEFIEECATENFGNHPENVSDYCRSKIFSITSEFIGASMACDCNPQGSLDFACSNYGGQCRCKPNVIGRSCERCAPGYYNFPDCLKCKCGIKQQCDERTGQCFCPRYVEGLTCDRCVQYAYGFDPLIGCQLCGCSINGSFGAEQRCDPMSGQCLCKDNVGGRRCEKCLQGYWAFSECRECDCQQSGTTDDVCDDRTSKCLCKKNLLSGGRCDRCRPGTFDLRKSDPDGCSECFCFRVTDRCRSSNWPIRGLRVSDQDWRVDDPNGKVLNDEFGKIIYEAGKDLNEKEEKEKSSSSVYFEIDLQPGVDYTRMYGLHLSFAISSFPRDERPRPNTKADVRLIAGNTVLEYWATEQPRNATQRFNVVVTLFPEYWLEDQGVPANRAQLMLTLLQLQRIQVKASYYERPSRAVLEHFQLEMADTGAPTTDENGMDRPMASSVELCECPTAYSGPSCQECSPGYYRLPIQFGQLLGSCVPCKCNGHSGSCDPATGICLNCQHNTEGEHCEYCREGFYGNATTGSAAACIRCPCPHPIESNNFARSCSVSELGILERCECREGYIGDRCEMCNTGFFGNPTAPNGGHCENCDCSGNNDLTNPAACHPQTGDCALCENNTDGRHCEQCSQWFWGDAVKTKNCTKCECHQCGSSFCDHHTGQCNCHPLVEGIRCDHCAENAWGIDSCRGCQPCNCGLAASNSQCDLKNGQCACMPGAAGQFCDRCDHGFWRYSPQGCQKCDCEADLSMGTVCDVNTGQCHCQEGATGSRCDKCLPNYLRVPGFGCRLCDECVYALAQETDKMETNVDYIRSILANVSSETLTGARLNRIQKQIGELEPALDSVIASNSPEAEEISSQIVPKARSLNEAASEASIREQRATEQLDTLNKRLDKGYEQLGEIRTNAQQLLEMTRLTVDRIGKLRSRFENQAPLDINIEKLKIQSEEKLQMIRKLDGGHSEALSEAQKHLENVLKTQKRISELKGQTEELSNKIGEEKERLGRLNEWREAFEEELQTVKSSLSNVKKNLDSRSMFSLRALIDGIEKDVRSIERSSSEQHSYLGNVTNILEQITIQRSIIDQLLLELSELRTQIPSIDENTFRSRRETEKAIKQKLQLKVSHLEIEANKVVGIYDAARLESNRTIEAANIYREIIESMKQARKQSLNAEKKMREAGEQMRAQNGSAKESRAKSKMLKEQSSYLNTETFRETKARADALSKREEQLMPIIAKIRNDLTEISQLSFKGISSALGDKDQLLLDIDSIRHQADQSHQRIEPLNENFQKMGKKLEDIDRRVHELMDSSREAETATAKDQIKQVIKSMPELKDEWEESRKRIDQTIANIKETRSRLTILKEKALLARDKANRVKLGAHFERESFLELPLPQTSDDFATVTDVRFFFRTRERNGFLFFIGNSHAQLAGEFLAIELENERPKMTLNLGGKSASLLQMSTPVSDMQWRELIILRRGKRATMKLSKPGGNADESDEEKSIELSAGKSILNIFDDLRHLFVGGIPPDFLLPTALQQRHFMGDLDKLSVNGELIGFWNSEKSYGITGSEMRQLQDAEKTAENGVTFNGRGYLQMDVGPWNPRKRTVIMLSFLTFSPDGLLFFVGKDRDQLVLELIGGRVNLLFDLGSGPAKLISNEENYNDGKWHLVEIDRTERAAKLQVDGTDKVEGESPGSLFEMSVSDSFFLGGLPTSIETTRFTVHPFRGCIRNLKLDADYISLARPKASKGVQSSCINRNVRVGTLLSERSFAQFTGLTLDGQLELCFRFLPTISIISEQEVHLLSVMVNNDQEELVRIHLENGGRFLAIRPNGDDTGLIRIELSHRLNGGWHLLCVQRNPKTMRVFVDDVIDEQREAIIEGVDLLNSNNVLLGFGHLESFPSFVGCIGDILFGGKLLSLAQSSSNELTLSGCSITSINTLIDESLPDIPLPIVDDNIERQTKEERKAVINTDESKISSSIPSVRPEGSCALPLKPHGEREDSSGYRFGFSSNSRLEFDIGPITGTDLTFTVHLRATASNGIIIFATDERHSQFAVLYLLNGKPAFSSKSAFGQLTIISTQSLLDGEWHSIRAQREGPASVLYIDGQMNVQNRTENLINSINQLDLQSPLFIGGLPIELVPFAARILPGVKSEFGGCLRNFIINGRQLLDNDDLPLKEIGTVPCSQFKEPGLFFGKEGGYAILDRQLVVGTSFSLELELKPRTKNAIIVSVGVLEFLSLQLLNGSVKFSVDNGAGVESVIFEPPIGSSLCDGHWHQIKIYKKKKLLTLNVNGKSSLRVLGKKSASETSTRDPLYLGGVPRDVKLKGLDTQEPYIGCIRVIFLGKKNRKRNVPDELAQDLELFGSVDRNYCPLN